LPIATPAPAAADGFLRRGKYDVVNLSFDRRFGLA
jgi:hypothetical protein